MVLETERLILRKWQESDWEPFFRMNSDPRVMEFFPSILSKEESDRLIERIQIHFDQNGYGRWVLESKESADFVGFTGFMNVGFASHFTPAVEIGWRIPFSFWGQGYATEAASACLQYGFSTLKFPEVVSFTSILNLRSESVMKRIGFKEAGFFAHPSLPVDHILSDHVLYKISNLEWNTPILKS
ncbi:GNAT family N-acetyltransferase [Leptospira sp. WS92.C1]